MHQQRSWPPGTNGPAGAAAPYQRSLEADLEPTSVLLVDDHRMFADLLSEALTTDGFTVAGICESIADAVTTARDQQPDVIVLDHVLPPGTGASNVATFRRVSPESRVLMLTASEDRAVLMEAMDAGCHGFITKRRPVTEVLEAIRSVMEDDTVISVDMMGALFGRRSGTPGGDLSPREREVLKLLGTGASNQQIATTLHLSPNTIRNHVQHIFDKLDAHSRLEAVAVAARFGLIPSDRTASSP